MPALNKQNISNSSNKASYEQNIDHEQLIETATDASTDRDAELPRLTGPPERDPKWGILPPPKHSKVTFESFKSDFFSGSPSLDPPLGEGERPVLTSLRMPALTEMQNYRDWY